MAAKRHAGAEVAAGPVAPPRPGWRPSAFDLGALVALAAVTVYVTARSYRYTYDDVYLAFVYTRNVVEGRGVTFNGAPPFLGTPAPLLVLLLVALKSALPGAAIPDLAGLLSGAAMLAATVAMYLLGRRLSGPAVGLAVALLVAVNPLVLETFGSETPLYLALVVWAFYCFFAGRTVPSAILLGLAFLCRSEALVPAGIIYLGLIVTRRRLPLREAAASLLVVTPWLAFATLYFGSPVTNSFWAKQAQVQGGLLPPLADGWLPWVRAVVIADQHAYLAFLPLFAAGLYYAARFARRWLVLLAWPALQTIAYFALGIPFYHWYAAAAGFGLATLAGLAVGALLGRGVAHAWPVGHLCFLRWPAGLALAALLAVALFAEARSHNRWVTGMPGPADLIYEQAGRWFAANSAPDATIAYYEIGRIGYVSQRPIVDLLGLVTPGVASRVAKGDLVWAYMRYKPDYIVFNEAFAGWTAPVRREPWFADSYEPVATVRHPGYPSPLVIYQKTAKARVPDPYLAVDVAQPRYDATAGDIYGEHVVRQRFVARRDGLAKVSLLLANYGRHVTAPLRFELRSESPDLPLAPITRVIAPESVLDNQWLDVAFDPISGSAGKTFTIVLSAPDAEPGNAFTVWTWSGRTHPELPLLLGRDASAASVTFKTWCVER